MGMSDAHPRHDDDDELNDFRRPGPELAPIVDKVLRMPEHRHLVENDARLHFLMRTAVKVKQGNVVLGTCYRPKVNGELSAIFDWLLARYLGETPDFLIVLDADYWADATPLQREILVFHELLHAAQALDADGAPKFNSQTGEPIWTIRGHDIEQFRDVVARYGSVDVHDVAEFIEAAREGDAALNLRRVR